MDYDKLVWEADYLLSDYGYVSENEEDTLGEYTLEDFPEITVHIVNGVIINVFLDQD